MVLSVFGVFLDASYSKSETGAWPHSFQFYFKFTSFIRWLTSGVSSDCTYGSCLVFKICNMIDWLANEVSICDFFLKKKQQQQQTCFPIKGNSWNLPFCQKNQKKDQNICILLSMHHCCNVKHLWKINTEKLFLSEFMISWDWCGQLSWVV